MRGRIYVDFDDVLSETARTIAGLVAWKFRKEVPFEALRFFDLDKSFGLSPAQLDELMGLLHEPGILLDMAPLSSASASLRLWSGRGYDVCVVTGRPPSAADASAEWLRRCNIPFESLIFVDKYGRSPPASGSIRALGLDEFRSQRFCLAVEDSADMAEYLATAMLVPVALLDRPWNAGRCADGERNGSIIRCADWQDIVSRFPSPE